MPETSPAPTLAREATSEPTMPPPDTVPVYAAGAGIPDLALDRLFHAGWTRYGDDLGDVAYVSPDGAVRAEFGPETRRYGTGGALWEVIYTDPDPYAKAPNTWSATFGAQVPAEAIAAFLATLTDPAGLELDRD
ncbi:MAG: DUF317 domain-containing protein [Catenulispora sp.]